MAEGNWNREPGFAPILDTESENALAAEISPSELLKEFLESHLPTALAPGGVGVGPMFDDQIKEGCVSLMDAGMPQTEPYLPLVWVRGQIRCLAPTLDQTDRIGRGVWAVLDKRNRELVRQNSTGSTYLIHLINITAGPSQHRDSDENYEALMFAEMCIGLDPVPNP